MTTVDLASALAASAGAPQAHLVTRPVGAAIRLLVERQLDALAAGTVAVLDFSGIGVLDRSCADEFVAKLMLPREGPMPTRDGYVVLRGLHDGHLDAIEAVLETHGLALVVQLPDGATRLVGAVTVTERRLWEQVMVGAACSWMRATTVCTSPESRTGVTSRRTSEFPPCRRGTLPRIV